MDEQDAGHQDVLPASPDRPGPAAAILPITGLPGRCPHCGTAPEDGLWALTVHGHELKVACLSCYTAVVPVRAAAAR